MFYTLKYRLDKQQYTKLYNYQRNIEKQGNLRKILRVTSGGNKTDFEPKDNKKINFGKKSYWVLRIKNTSESDNEINIDKQMVIFKDTNVSNKKPIYYRIPRECDNIDIQTKTQCEISYMESKIPTTIFDWSSILVTSRDKSNQSTHMNHFKSSKGETLKFYKCFKKEQHWLINFSVKKLIINYLK